MPELQHLTGTRRTLHGIAELLMAGPQYRRSGTIRLRIAPGGFATVRDPDLRVDTDALVVGDRRIAIAGTYTGLGAAAGVEIGAPAGLYHDGSGVDAAERVDLDPAAAGHLLACFALGDAAVRQFAPSAEPVLWPEHFDLAVSLDEVNYGMSPGDGALGEPYAYVGPWQPRHGDFWNAPFGAARPLGDLVGTDPVAAGQEGIDALAAFFGEGRDRARSGG